MDIGNAIQLARKKRKLSQAELAERAGISASYLSMLERNRRPRQAGRRAVGVDGTIKWYAGTGC